MIMSEFTVFTFDFNGDSKSFHCDELSKFCLNKHILYKQVSFFCHDESPYWSVFLEYETVIKASKPNQFNLAEADRLCYEKLRAWRQDRAEKEGIPPYIIAKNSHLAEIADKKIKTKEGLKQIHGFGKSKLEKYGDDILDLVRAFYEADTPVGMSK